MHDSASTTADKDDQQARLRRSIEHTLLMPEATRADIARHLEEAVELGLEAVCLRPTLIPADTLGLRVVTVCGFPSGAHDSRVKALEAELALRRGASEIDMVIDLGAVKARDWVAVRADIESVRAVVPAGHILKVIIESAALTRDEILECCRVGSDTGADFLKTSTGYHPAGGANLEAVRLMVGALSGNVQVKASGGIRTAAQARAFIDAGATRLGVSSTRALLGTSGASAPADY